jgi:type VI protein secretion system component Hcp
MEVPDFISNGNVFKTAIESFNWPANRASMQPLGGNSGGASGVPSRNVVVSRARDKHSPAFHQSAAITKHYKKLTITVSNSEKGALQSLQKITFYNVVFFDYQFGSAPNGHRPIETFSMDYAGVQFNK